jgi:hypothetical protein
MRIRRARFSSALAAPGTLPSDTCRRSVASPFSAAASCIHPPNENMSGNVEETQPVMIMNSFIHMWARPHMRRRRRRGRRRHHGTE